VVGNMRHSVEKLRARAKRVLVLERSIGLRDEGSYPDTAGEEVIPKGDLVFITGATLCNGTIDRVLELSKNAREVVVLGATAGIFPSTLFQKGATAVATMEILDAEKAMRAISQGGGKPALIKNARLVVFRPRKELPRAGVRS